MYTATRVRIRGTCLRALATLAALAIVAGAATAQPGSIAGAVSDASTKAPLVGCTVWIPDLKVGAITNGKGEYEIRGVPAGKRSVQAKTLSYYTKNLSVVVESGKTATLNFALAANPLQQQEIVVTGLTGEVDRKTLGNDISYVGGETIARVASPSAIDALSGSTAGIEVTRSSGVPGAGTYITLRGRKSILGSSEPLYVVDGVLIDNSTNIDGVNFQQGTFSMGNRVTDINPQDIASIEILKGASAAAIYGSEAANGVILITTKHGQFTGSGEHPTSITYTTSEEGGHNVGHISLQTVFGQKSPGSTSSYGAPIPAGSTIYAQDEVPFHTSFSNEQSLAVTGGTGAMNYFASMTYSNIEGTALTGSSLNRKNIRFNFNTTVLPHLDLQSNSNYINSVSDFPQDGSNTSGILLGALRTPANFDNSKYLEDDGTTQHQYAFYDNPVWAEHFNTVEATVNRFIHSSTLKYTPVDWLTAEGRVGIDKYTQTNFIRLGYGSANSPSALGQVDHWVYTSDNLNTDLTLTAQHRFGDDILGTLVAGNQVLVGSSTTNESESETTVPFFDQINAGATHNGISSIAEARKVGFFAQATGTWRERLTLTGGMRYDGSSTFNINNQFHTYPKGSAAYVISEEQWFKDLHWTFVNQFKLRGSYGLAGSPSLPGAYATNVLYTTAGYNDQYSRATTANRAGFPGMRMGGGITSAEYAVYGNESIDPELHKEREGGFDLTLWDNRVTLSGTTYHDDISSLILAVPVAGSTGWDMQLRNAGTMFNGGVEWSLSIVPVNGENFSWTTTVNYARNYNLVTSLAISPGVDPAKDTGFVLLNGGFTGINNIAQVGRPLGVFMGTGWLRDAHGHIVYSTGSADDYAGNNYSGTPRIANNVILGDPNPAYTVSWRNSFTFLNDFTLTVLVDAVEGFNVWNGTRGALVRVGTAGETADRNDLWFNFDGTPVMNLTNGKQLTRQVYYQSYGNDRQVTEPYIEDGSFIKIREASLSYRWHGLSDWNISTVVFTVTGRNLATITKYKGFDPEVNTFNLAEGRGFDFFTLPQVRSIRLNVAVTY